jgi:MFS family permease
MSHLQHFAVRPHPIGSEAQRRVRDYLVKTLTALGAAVHVEKTTGVHARGRTIYAGTAHNIVATFPGRANRRAVMLVAHYDSVPEGPGAADDGAGLISILETIRALRMGPVPRNDLIVLFTDGEEPGLLGASGFVADHPDLASHVGVVLNLEARGSSGPAMMFETSDQNGWLISELARATPYPMASSLMYSVYKLLPNDTDFSVLKTNGVAGLNFAFIESFQDYHSRRDTRERLSPRSVQQMGANTLALARHFGNLPLTQVKKPDCVYFNWLGFRLVHYPMWVALALPLLIFGLLVFAFVLAHRRRALSLSPTLPGAFFLLLLVVGGGMNLLWSTIKLFVGRSLPIGDTAGNISLFAGLVLVGFCCGISLLGAMTSRLGLRNVHAALLLVAAVLALLIGLLLPGASYLLQWPAFFGGASLLLGLRAKSPAGMALWGLVAVVPALLLLFPLIYPFFVVLQLNLLSLLAATILLTFLLAVSWPVFDFIIRPWRRTCAIAALIALGFILGGALLAHPRASHPRRDSLVYSLNTDRGKAKWISYDDAVDQWTRQFLGSSPRRGPDPEFTAGSDRNLLTADAPPLSLPAPTVTRESDSTNDGIRTLHLHIAVAPQNRTLLVRMPAELDLRTVTWNRRSPLVNAVGKHPWTLHYEAVPPEGVDLELRLGGRSVMNCWIAAVSPGLPRSEDHTFVPRRDNFVAGQGSDCTLVARHYSF